MTLVHGVELRADRDRIAMFVEAGKGPYEPETVAAFVAAVENDPKGYVIDVGAYTGLYTILALKAGAAEVLALEPNPAAHGRLIENLRADGVRTSSVLVLKCAAGSVDGSGTLDVTGEHRAICSTGKLRKELAPDGPSVTVAKIDNLVWYRVSVMKLDVEGHELEALQGAAVTLDTDHPVLFVEVNSGSGGDRTEAVRDYLAGFGYEGAPLDDRNMVFRVP